MFPIMFLTRGRDEPAVDRGIGWIEICMIPGTSLSWGSGRCSDGDVVATGAEMIPGTSLSRGRDEPAADGDVGWIAISMIPGTCPSREE